MTWDARTARVAEQLRLAAKLIDEGAVGPPEPPGPLDDVLASDERALARLRVAEQIISGVGVEAAEQAMQQAERLATLAALFDGRPDLAEGFIAFIGVLLRR